MKKWIVKNILYRWFKPWMIVNVKVSFDHWECKDNFCNNIFAIGTDGMLAGDTEIGMTNNTFEKLCIDNVFMQFSGADEVVRKVKLEMEKSK